MASKPFTIDQAQAAYLLGVDSRSISTWAKRSIDPLPIAKQGKRGQPNEYDPAALVLWFVRNELSKLSIEDGELLDLNNERAKLARLQAKKVELDLFVREGKMIDVELAGERIERVFLGCRAHFLALPLKAAPVVHGCATVPETAEEIRKAVYESLEALSAMTVVEIMKRATHE